MRRALRLLDYVFLLRPVILVPGWVFLLLGYGEGCAAAGAPASRWVPTGRLALALAVGTALMGGMYILNQITDRESDRRNRKLFLISEGRVTLRAAWAEMLLLQSAALVTAWAVFPRAFAVLSVLSVAAGIAYSVRPLRLKGRPVWDIVANGVGFGGVAFAMGWALAAPLGARTAIRALPFILAVGAVHTNATVLDLEGDRASGDRTIAVLLGVGRTLWLGCGLALASFLAALVLRDLLTSLWGVLSTVAFARAARRAEKECSAPTNQLSGRAFVVLEALRFVYLLAGLAVVYVATKWYYRSRFGMDYPSMRDNRPPAPPDGGSAAPEDPRSTACSRCT
jgi:4-hydroxybenzoate polyprenyltransferase